MHKKTTQFLISIVLLSITSIGYSDNAWELTKEEDGIQVYVRDTPNAAVKSFKGTMTVKTRLTTLVAVLGDAKSFPGWLHNCKSAKTIKQVGNIELFNYIVTNMPWPVSDRDTVVHSKLSQNKANKAIEIKLNAVSGMTPRKSGKVRIQNMNGHWLFTPSGKDEVKVVYEMSVDPGGSIPKWLVNSLAVDLPFHTLKKLRKVIKNPVYQNAKLDYIID